MASLVYIDLFCMYADTSQKRQNGEITSCPLMAILFDWTQPSGILEPAGEFSETAVTGQLDGLL